MSNAQTAINRRAVLLGAGCCLIGGVATVMTPRRPEALIGSARLADIIPARVGPWQEAPDAQLILPDAPKANRYYDQVLTRTFAGGPGAPIMLLIAYAAAQSGLMQVHRPEVCYDSAGFDIRDMHAAFVASGQPAPVAAQSFVAEREDRSEQVLYWTRISDAFPRSLTSQRLVTLRRGLQGILPDGVLVRASTIAAPSEDGLRVLKAFGAELIASAGPIGRTLLVGHPKSS